MAASGSEMYQGMSGFGIEYNQRIEENRHVHDGLDGQST